MLGVDGKLLSTARLLFRPGRLTLDYLAGRHAVHVGPVRIYLACSALLFALIAAQAPDTSPRAQTEFRMFGMARVSVDMPDSVARRLEHLPNPGLYARATLRMRAAMRAGPERHAELEQRTVNAIPQTFFLMVPAYAAVMWLAAPRPRRHYPAHLCYALHVHAFAFAALAGALGARAVAQRVADRHTLGAIKLLQLVFATAGAGALWYTLLAYRRVYTASWPATVVRVIGSTALYAVVLAVALAALMVVVLLIG